MKAFTKSLAILFSAAVLTACSKETSDGKFDSGGTVGIGGSTSKFTIAKNHLYTLDEFKLKVFNLNNPTQPTFVSEFGGEGLETLYPYKDFLFVGAETGMYTFSIANPSQPQLLSTYIHIRSCDPVVVNDTIAFVTLRSDNNCRIGTGANQLEIINIKNKNNPQNIGIIELNSPKGLGLIGNKLAVCTGSGMYVYDVSNPYEVQELKIYPQFIGNDVIPMGEIMIMTSDFGVFVLDIQDLNNIKQKAKLS